MFGQGVWFDGVDIGLGIDWVLEFIGGFSLVLVRIAGLFVIGFVCGLDIRVAW